MRDTFILHTAYAEKFKRLTDEQFGMLIRSLMNYQSTGTEQEIKDQAVAFAFDVAKVELDFANRKYDEVCEKRRIAGSMGGLAKASKCKQKVAKGSKSSKTYHNENDNDNENDNHNDYDNDSISNSQSKNLNKQNNSVKENNTKESQRYFPNDDLLEKTFSDFRDMRKKIKKPMTDRAITLMLNKLTKLSNDPLEQVKILEQSILNCWQDIYELKAPKGDKQTSIQSIVERWANVH